VQPRSENTGYAYMIDILWHGSRISGKGITVCSIFGEREPTNKTRARCRICHF